jgi:ATP-binding cassette subfamily B protein
LTRNEDLPPTIAELAVPPDDPPVLVARGDLLADGAFGQVWVVVAGKRLRVVEETSSGPQLRHDLLLEGLRSPRTEELVGGGVLQARLDGVPTDLVRYTNGSSTDFSRLGRYLTDVAKYHDWLRRKEKGRLQPDEPEIKPPEPAKDESEPKRCPRCDLPLIEGSRVCPACFKKHRVILRILAYLKPQWQATALFVLLLLAGTAVSLVPPYLTRPLVDGVLTSTARPGPERLALLGWLVLAMAGSGLGVLLVGIWRGRLVALLATRLGHQLRSEVFRCLQGQSLRFFDKHKTGALMTRIAQDTQALEAALIDGVPYFVSNILTLLAIAGILFWLNWRLTLVLFVPGPLVALLSRWCWSRLIRIMQRYFHVRSRLNSVLNDSLSGVRVIKAFAQEPQETRRFDRLSGDLSGSLFLVEKMWATYFPIITFVTGIGALVVWYFGGRGVIGGGSMTPGTLLAFVAYLGMFYGPLQFLSRISDWLIRALASAERIFEIIDKEPDVPESTEAVAMPVLRGHVEFRDVNFGYDEQKAVLKRINLDVAPGEMIGLVGKSGAGKTSTINVLCRFYDVQEGAILIDGVDLRRILQQDLRRQIGVVLQDTFLFNDTIHANIRYARPDAGPEEVMAAAKAANAHDFIVNKPDGYDTVVGERGAKLSGGERQRIAIARAILHNPRILILDEATSNVDADTEKEIQDALARLIEGRTVFAIAHRLSTLRNAHRLVVLKEGEIVEIGTHDELIAKQGEFFRLVELQKQTSAIRAVGGGKEEKG